METIDTNEAKPELDYKEFHRITNITIRKHCSKKFMRIFDDEDNHALVFNEVVTSYYRWRPTEDKKRTAITYAVWRGSFAIKDAVKKHFHKPNKHMKLVYTNEFTPYFYDEQPNEYIEHLEYFIQHSGLTANEIKYINEVKNGSPTKEIASKFNTSLQNAYIVINKAYNKIRNLNEFPKVQE